MRGLVGQWRGAGWWLGRSGEVGVLTTRERTNNWTNRPMGLLGIKKSIYGGKFTRSAKNVLIAGKLVNLNLGLLGVK